MANDTSKYEIYLGFDVQILKTILKVIYYTAIRDSRVIIKTFFDPFESNLKIGAVSLV